MEAIVGEEARLQREEVTGGVPMGVVEPSVLPAFVRTRTWNLRMAGSVPPDDVSLMV